MNGISTLHTTAPGEHKDKSVFVTEPEVTTLPYMPITIDTDNAKIVAGEIDPMVEKPEHYQTRFGFETIDVMDAFTEDLKGMQAVDTAQVIKYITRWAKKDGLRDLKKARYYLDHVISIVEGGDIGDHE